MQMLRRFFVSAFLVVVVGLGCSNKVPVADAGPDQSVQSGTTVTLEGRASGGQGSTLSYLWMQVAGTPVTLSNATNASPTFTAPSTAGALTFMLVVSDGHVSSAPDQVSIVVLPTDSDRNHAPSASAGNDRTVLRRATVVLEGSGSDADNDALSYTWTQTSGPPVTLVGAATSRVTFTAPDTETALTFSLTVSDGELSASDEVMVRVGNRDPVISSMTLSPSGAKTLDDLSLTLVASDADGDPLTISYVWKRNGTLVAGETRSLYPHTLTTKGDTITATATVSDGVSRALVEQSVVIQDTPPSVSAGGDRTVFRRAPVALEGSGSDADNDALSYTWTQTSGPPVTLAGTGTSRVTFTAPDMEATLIFSLTVSAGERSASDDVVIRIGNFENRDPVISSAVLSPSVAKTLDDVSLTLVASDADGDPLTTSYLWKRNGTTVADATRPTYPHTLTTKGDTITVVATVSDGITSVSVERSVVIQDTPPSVSAGNDRTVFRRTPVTLEGSGSDADNDALSYTWTQTSGPPVTLAGTSTSRVTFTAPDTKASLTFSLTVSTGELSVSDSVMVNIDNRNPVISSAVLSPSGAKTLDDLSLTLVASDADGDPLTTSYGWKRNGTTVAGENRSTYPHSLTTKGDTITVTATVSDGIASVSVERSVVIQDTLPSLTAASPPPAQTNHCSAVAFDLVASDPDGDPLGDFVVRHGPAGMNVSATGKVTWDACLPMFDRSLDVNWGVGLSLHPAAKVVGVLKVNDPSRQYLLRRTGIEIPVYDSGLQVTDLDGNGTQEMLIASRRVLYVLAKADTAYAQSWVYPFVAPDGGDFTAVVARDLDGDGKQEIFFASKQFVVKLDGVHRREVARYETGATYGCRDLEIADLSGDGDLELVCLGAPDFSSNGEQVVVFNPATLSVEWKTPTGGLGLSLALGNVDTDAALEIVTAKGYVYDGATQVNQWAYGPGFGSRVDTGDLDGDGVEEIVGMADWYTVTGFNAVLKSPIWEVKTSDNDALLVTDFEGDAKAEILVGAGQWGNVTAYRYEASNNTVPVIFTINSQDHGVSSIGVGDVDGDGKTEFVWGTGATSSGEDMFVVAGRNPTIAVEWKNTNPSQLDGPFVGGHYARLTSTSRQLLFGSVTTDSGYAGNRLISLDPMTGATQVSKEIGTNWDNAFAFTVADYDRDGRDEALVATSNTYDGYFTAYDFSSNTAKWTSAVGMGPAGAVVNGDVNADGFPDFVAITTDGYVHVYDVKNQVLIWKSTALGAGLDVELVDVDQDGTKEIVALTNGAVYVYARASSGPAGYVQRATVSVSGAADLVVADLDGNLAQELYVLQASYSSTTTTVHRFNGALAADGTFTVPTGTTTLHVEALGSGRRNLLIGVAVGSSTYSPTAVELRAVDPRSGAEIWRSPPLAGMVSKNSVFFADVGGTTLPEIAFATQYGMNVTR
jgi:hypothetical protein